MHVIRMRDEVLAQLVALFVVKHQSERNYTLQMLIFINCYCLSYCLLITATETNMKLNNIYFTYQFRDFPSLLLR